MAHRMNKQQRLLSEMEKLRGDKPVFPYPDDLEPHLQPIWLRTVNSMPADFWHKGDAPLLRIYCRNVYDVDRLTEEIDTEGDIIENNRGNPIVNPKCSLRFLCENRVLALASKLRLQPVSRGKAEDDVSRGQAAKKGHKAGKAVHESDGLLAGAKPTYN